MTEKITFQENAERNEKLVRSLRARLGPLGFTVTFVAIVLGCLVVGAGVSILIKTLRRPPIVAPSHGAVSQAVLASIAPHQ
jgi:hypothetical protein